MQGPDGLDVELHGPVSLKVINAYCPNQLWAEIKKANPDQVHAKLMPEIGRHHGKSDSTIVPVHINGERSIEELFISIRQAMGLQDVQLRLVAFLVGDIRYVKTDANDKRQSDGDNLNSSEKRKIRRKEKYL